MALHDTLMAFLTKEGYAPQSTEFGFQFKYQGLDFLHFKDEQDELFFNLFFPSIFEVTPENRADLLTAIDKTNAETKVAKGSIRFENSVWVGVEMLLPKTYDFNDFVLRSIDMMVYYRDAFYRNYAETPTGKAALEAAQKK